VNHTTANSTTWVSQKNRRAGLDPFVCDSPDLSQKWLIDVLHVNVVEGLQFAAGCVPLIAAAVGWGQADACTVARLAGSLRAGSVVAASPIMLMAILLLLAKARQMAKTDGAKGLWRETAEGGATTGTALGVAAAIGEVSALRRHRRRHHSGDRIEEGRARSIGDRAFSLGGAARGEDCRRDRKAPGARRAPRTA